MKKLVQIIFLLSFLWFVIHEITIIYDGLSDNHASSDFAVVLGNKVNVDGTLSDRLKARVDKSLELYKSSKVEKIFVSGGFGKEGHYEGSKMAEYLIQQGVPKSDVLVDNEGNNTQLTADNFASRVGTSNSVIVVSQFYHISRIKLAFRKSGIHSVGSSHADFFETRDMFSLFREFFAYYKYLLK
ncbi:YdcF family protein [Aureibacter tunicatorum]|uniref:Vancomycin permeability regulator SanA n=1 Tax=Aureibacter tunicatorum TaxID=866807 RepID=A0AAE3XPH0_9BACT|nr:YdcF family protein [Aureibacter tunicatorum]MDR6240303.1 vancomycin permeability regulator SanA [Aureibacter tunicatorum]BDD05816.1 hypothetical protein AUTU_32990 [Aureibacter tunicatorum]